MSKRARGNNGRAIIPRASRPIDKKLVYIQQTLSSAAQTSTTLLTATFPCTVVGLRWNFSAVHALATGDGYGAWAIVIVRDGVTASTMSQSNAADFYTPEQDVLAFGVFQLRDSDVGSGPSIYDISGSTKTMRKLMGGDTLQLLGISGTVNAQSIRGVVQYFCKG